MANTNQFASFPPKQFEPPVTGFPPNPLPPNPMMNAFPPQAVAPPVPMGAIPQITRGPPPGFHPGLQPLAGLPSSLLEQQPPNPLAEPNIMEPHIQNIPQPNTLQSGPPPGFIATNDDTSASKREREPSRKSRKKKRRKKQREVKELEVETTSSNVDQLPSNLVPVSQPGYSMVGGVPQMLMMPLMVTGP
eukprot:UN24263